MKTAAHFDQLNIPLINIQKIIIIVFFMFWASVYFAVFVSYYGCFLYFLVDATT